VGAAARGGGRRRYGQRILQSNILVDTCTAVRRCQEPIGSAGFSRHIGSDQQPLGSDTNGGQNNLAPPPIPATARCFPPVLTTG
jgi:hypothetical protein